MEGNHNKRLARHGILLIGITAIVGFVVQLLWNWLIPDLFNGPSISYLQALGLFILTKLLFSHPHHVAARPHFDQRYWRDSYRSWQRCCTGEEEPAASEEQRNSQPGINDTGTTA